MCSLVGTLLMSVSFAAASEINGEWSTGCEPTKDELWRIHSIKLDDGAYTETTQNFYDSECKEGYYFYPLIKTASYKVSNVSDTGVELSLSGFDESQNGSFSGSRIKSVDMYVGFLSDGSAAFTYRSYTDIYGSLDPELLKRMKPYTLKRMKQ